MALPSTAWKPGQSGNPSGKPATKIVADALRIAAKRTVEGDKRNRTALQVAAEEMLALAMAGDKEAFCIVRDSLDGKPVQAVQHEGDGQPLLSFLVQLAEPEPSPKVIEAQPEPETGDNPDTSKA